MMHLQDPDEHSYEAFSQRPFYRAMDRLTISLAPVAERVLDMATGTGAMISLLLEEGKLRPGGRVTGVDVDQTAIDAAMEKFHDPAIRFLCASVEALPFDPWQL